MHGMARAIWLSTELSTRIYGTICIRVVYSYASTVRNTGTPIIIISSPTTTGTTGKRISVLAQCYETKTSEHNLPN